MIFVTIITLFIIWYFFGFIVAKIAAGICLAIYFLLKISAKMIFVTIIILFVIWYFFGFFTAKIAAGICLAIFFLLEISAKINKISNDAKIQRMIDLLLPNSDIKGYCVSLGTPNALAFSDEHSQKCIVVSKELLSVLNDEELLFVVGHEIIHHQKNHLIIKSLSELAYGNVLNWLKSSTDQRNFLQKLFSNPEDTDNPWWVYMIQGAAYVFKAKLYQKEEFEADSGSISLLCQKNINPEAAHKALTKIKNLCGEDDVFEKFLSKFIGEHPNIDERIRRAQQLSEVTIR